MSSYLNNQFCKMFSEFWGTEISSPKDISDCNLTGEGLKRFCEYYFKNTISEESYQMAKSDRKVSRLLWFSLGFLAAGILVFIAQYINIPFRIMKFETAYNKPNSFFKDKKAVLLQDLSNGLGEVLKTGTEVTILKRSTGLKIYFDIVEDSSRIFMSRCIYECLELKNK